jgi:ribonuclease R
LAKKPLTNRSKKAERPFPSREQILEYIAEHPGQAGKRDIARAFGITGGAKIALKSLLKSLSEDGLVEKKRRRLKRPSDLPTVSVLDVTGRDSDGELIAEPTEWPPEGGAPPKMLIQARRTEQGPPPGIGDRVLARLSPGDPDGPQYVARIIKVLEKKPTAVIGVFRAAPGGTGGRIEPVDRKQKELVVDGADAHGAKDGDLVSVEITRSGRFGLNKARIREIVGSMKSEKAVSLIAILEHGIPHVFPSELLAEAAKAKPATLAGRDDWSELPLLTIDPPDAKDHDDAVHAEPDPDPNNPGGVLVTVAIADVAAYVRPGSALDREALKRGNSVYFPDRVVPMLPERISNDLCSLRENEDRPALAVRMVFTADGRKRGHRFHRIMMRSAAKLSYQAAQEASDGRPGDLYQNVRQALARLWAAYEILKRGRDERRPLDLDLPERKVLLKPDGTIDRIVVPERLEAHRLIEEFMIQANVAAAETLEAKKSPLVYRIHDAPSLAKLEALREFLASIEMNLPKAGNLRPSHFNQILERAKTSEHGPLLNEVVLRSQSQAEYHPENIGHFGLNLRRYAHFTSPIRRYADLIVHRALIRALGFGNDGLPDGIETQLPEIAAQISAAERRAMVAERDTIDRLVAHWLADRIGATFNGRISGVTRAGLFVKLDNTGADGFVPMSTLGQDYFRYDEAKHAVIGARTGEMHRLGDRVEVRLVEAAPLAGALRFELLSEGRVLPRSERRSAPVRGRRQDGGRRAEKKPAKHKRKR